MQETLQKDNQTEEKKHLQEEIRDLQAALVQCQNEVSHLKDLVQERTEEVNKAIKKRQTRTIAYIDVMNELNVAQAALQESTNKCEVLEKNHQAQLEANLQLHQRELEANEERFRRELSDQAEKLKKELSDREEAFRNDLSEKEKAFQKTLQGLSDQWEARAKEWAERERELEEMLQNMGREEAEALQVCLPFPPLWQESHFKVKPEATFHFQQLNTDNPQKKRRRIWRVWKWKIWRRFK